MMPFIYLVILVTFVLLGIAFLIKDYALGAIAAMLIIIIGIYIAINGLIGINNFLTQSLAVISIAIGAYVLIRGAIETIY